MSPQGRRVAADVAVGRPSALADDLPCSLLAEAARRALGAHAAVVLRTDGPAALPLGASGLDDAELEAVAGAEDGGGGAPPRGFGTAERHEAVLPAGPAVAIWVLRRGTERFAGTSLAAAFARHAALAVLDLPGARDVPAPAARPRPAFGDRLLGEPSEEAFVALVAEEVAVAVGPARVGLHAWDEQGGTLQLVAGSLGRTAGPEIPASPRDRPVDWESCAARVFATGLPYLTNDAAGDPGVLPDDPTTSGVRRLIAVPLEAAGRPVGVLVVADPEREVGLPELHAVRALAGDVAFGLVLTRRAVAIRRRVRVEAALGAAAVGIASGRSLQELLGTALGELRGAVRADVLGFVPVSGEPVLAQRDGARSELTRIMVAEAREAGSVRAYVVPPRRAEDLGWAALHLPVHADGVRVATLAAVRHHGAAFGHDERRALSRLANLVALAWATEGYQHKRAEQARRAERQRIGDALHDATAQLLFAAKLRIDAALEDPDITPAVADGAAHARRLIVRADESLRETIHELADRGQEGLDDVLIAVVGAVEDEFRRPVQLELVPSAVAASHGLGRSATDLLAKVAREGLVNAAKYAGPGTVSLRVALSSRDRLVLTVADDGIGTPGPRRGGHGIASLRSAVRRHGGVLRVRTAPAGGTTVTVSLPL